MLSAYILVQPQVGADPRQVCDTLRALAGVKTAHNSAGHIDAIVEAANVEALMDTARKVRATPGVADTELRLVLE